MASVNVPPLVVADGPGIERWGRQVAEAVNTALREVQQRGGAFYVWNDGCRDIPQNTTIAGAEEFVFESPFVGYGTLVLTVVGAAGNVNVALNTANIGTLSGGSGEVLYEVAVDNLVEGLNSFEIWDTATDAAEIRRIEVWRNFSREQIEAAEGADWGDVTNRPTELTDGRIDAALTATTGVVKTDKVPTAAIQAQAVTALKTTPQISGSATTALQSGGGLTYTWDTLNMFINIAAGSKKAGATTASFSGGSVLISNITTRFYPYVVFGNGLDTTPTGYGASTTATDATAVGTRLPLGYVDVVASSSGSGSSGGQQIP